MSHECNNVNCFDDSPHDCHDENCEVCSVQEESEAVKALRAVIDKLHRMPFSPKEFLGSGLWSEIQNVLGEKDEEE